MKTNRIFFFLGISVLAVTVGCETKPKVKQGQYWQRANTSETIYINGPKAQQLLNRDIASCVTELRELERLGQIKDAIPTTKNGRVLNPDEKTMHEVDTPERDGYLFAEHKNYTDFESCMAASGWERTQTITYETAKRSEKNFFANHIDFKNKRDEHVVKGDDKSLDNDDFND